MFAAMSNFEADIERSLEALRSGGTLLYPTDTIWGLGCDATNADAVQQIFEIKKRPAEKSMIVLVADPKDILKYIASPDPAVFDFIKALTRPTTIIYDGAIGLAANLVQHDGTIAIRVVKEKFCYHLLKRFRKPIVSTSANFSGTASPKIFKEIDSGIKKAVDYVVNYRQEDESIAAPSAVIKWNKNGTQTVIRP